MNLINRKNGFLTPSSKEEFFFPIEQYFEQFYQDFFRDFNCDKLKSTAGYPKMDVYVENDHFYIKMALPGVKADDVKLEIFSKNDGKVMEISGKMSEEFQSDKDPNYFIKELKKSTFMRQVYLPNNLVNAEEPDALLKDGILTLKWSRQKSEPQKMSKIVQIKNES